MSNDRQEAKRFVEPQTDLTPEQVKDYLRAHPDFLVSDPETISLIVPPSQSTGRNVLDMQQFLIERLQRQVRTLRDIQSDLIEASSINSLAREQVHAAVNALLAARSFEDLLEYISSPHGMARTLGVKAAALCIETAGRVTSLGLHSLRTLEHAGVARMLDGAEKHRLTPYVRGSRSLYGDAAGGVQSEALIKLDFSPATPPGLLALGGMDPEQFHPDQAVDLLEFLGQVIEHCICRWLDLPPKP